MLGDETRADTPLVRTDAYGVPISPNEDFDDALVGARPTAAQTQVGTAARASRGWITIIVCVVVVAAVLFVIALIASPTDPSTLIRGPPCVDGKAHPTTTGNVHTRKQCRCTDDGKAQGIRFDTLVAQIRKIASVRGDIGALEYMSNPTTHAGKRILVRNSDFINGTLRITTSAYVAFLEDVTFDPNSLPHSANHPHRIPRAAVQPLYTARAYTLGFFAAITIEAKHVVVDLNGHELSTSRAFDFVQRAPYAHISIGDRPFIHGEGPANFGGGSFRTANGLIVRNGRLGRSSHHGIHGNGGRHVMIDDVKISRFEVAGFACNGCRDVLVRASHIGPTRRDVPARAMLTQSTFLLRFAEIAIASPSAIAHAIQHARVTTTYDALSLRVSEARDDIVLNGLMTVDEVIHPRAYALFGNKNGLADGACYGLVIHKLGHATNGFASGAGVKKDLTAGMDLRVERTTVRGIRCSPTERIALSRKGSGRPIVGTVGDVFPIKMVQNATSGAYVSNEYADLVVALADLVSLLPPADRAAFGTINVPAGVRAWALTGVPSLTSLVATGRFEYLRNGDSQFHVMTGVVAIRIGGTVRACLASVDVFGVKNDGPRPCASSMAGEPRGGPRYHGAHDGGHPQQAPHRGYSGGDVRAVSISASADVAGINVNVRDVEGRFGWSHALDAFADTNGVCYASTSVNGVSTLEPENPARPSDFNVGPKAGRAIACAWSDSTRDVDCATTRPAGGVIVSDVRAGYVALAADVIGDYKE